MLSRAKRLGRGEALQSRTPLTRSRKRLPARSPKTARVYVTRRQVVAGILEARPWCQIRWDAGCQRRSAHVHEPEMRSRGADILDPDTCVAACRHCHDMVHGHPAEATERGWLIPSGNPAGAA